MAEANSNDNNNNTSVAQQQQLLLQQQQRQRQQQLFLMHQQQLQLHQQQQQQQQQQQLQRQQQQQQQSIHQPTPYNLLQQQAISRFPSNIDAHLRAPGLRSAHFQPNPPPPSSSQPSPAASNFQQHHSPQQSQPARPPTTAVGTGRPGNPAEVEMAQKDAFMVCNPDYKRPFASVEDAVLRLLPYHVVSDYEAEEDDRILDSDTTGNVVSRLQQWDHNILSKIAEFTTTFERQVLAFNIMSRKRGLGEFRSEERLMIEQALLHEEKQALLKVRAEIESRERAGREASEAKMRMAMLQTEHAHVEASGHAGMFAHAPFRANAAASLADEASGNVGGQEQGGNVDEIQGWGNTQREDEEPSEDFLNDENEPDNADTAEQGEWQEVGELDLNSRR